MKEHNLDYDYPVNLQTDNLYSLEYLKWSEDFTNSIKALLKPTGKVNEGEGA